MKEYRLATMNIHNSLVFYRALFDRMPDALDGGSLRYQSDDISLVIVERDESPANTKPMILSLEKIDVIAAYRRLERFLGKEKWLEDCDKLNDAFGVKDPDGHRWHIGNPEAKIHFEKCYF